MGLRLAGRIPATSSFSDYLILIFSIIRLFSHPYASTRASLSLLIVKQSKQHSIDKKVNQVGIGNRAGEIIEYLNISNIKLSG